MSSPAEPPGSYDDSQLRALSQPLGQSACVTDAKATKSWVVLRWALIIGGVTYAIEGLVSLIGRHYLSGSIGLVIGLAALALVNPFLAWTARQQERAASETASEEAVRSGWRDWFPTGNAADRAAWSERHPWLSGLHFSAAMTLAFSVWFMLAGSATAAAVIAMVMFPTLWLFVTLLVRRRA